jgi:calcium-binding protein CML
VENGSVDSGSGGGRYSDRSGSIDANELGRVLSQGRVAFSPQTLRLMLHLSAGNKSDMTRIGPVGFAKL